MSAPGALAAPTQIGPYAVTRELGRGGMGVVYLARDPKLDRDVAIKALPAHLAGDADRLSRFQREAKVLASLNHPGIAGIYGLEDIAGTQYLVLEFVDGETIAARLNRGLIPVDEALALAKQIAEALEAAHEKGVVHRDLKPGNVMVNTEGRVKVLDFGLARTGDGAPSTSSYGASAHSPTLTAPPPVHSPTIAGAIMGTAGYMSPEQARGRAVDKRSDIFSFGCVLFEMLSGRQPFSGETVADSLGATLHKELDLATLPPGTPPRVRDLLSRCLAKDRHQRLHDIADARIELDRAIAGQEWAAHAGARSSAPAARLVFGVAALLGAIVMLAAGWFLASRLAAPAVGAGLLYATIDGAPGTSISADGDLAGPAVISPDGRMVAFSARSAAGAQALCVRALDVAEPDQLRGTEYATFPFWSPDGHAIGFFAEGKLRRIDLATRTVRTLCDAPGARGGTWFESGDIVFTPAFQAALFRIPASGGEPVAITTVDKARFSSHRWPNAVRGTNRFTYLAVNHDPSKREETSVYFASLDGAMNKEVIHSPFGTQVVGDRLLFLRENTLLAVAIDTATGTLRGEPVAVLPDVRGDTATWNAGFSASETGALVYHAVPPPEPNAGAPGGAKTDAPDTGDSATRPQAGLGESVRATVLSKSGAAAVIADGMLQNSLAASPDGLQLAVSGRWPNDNSTAGYDIWIFTMFGAGSDFSKSRFEPVQTGGKPRRFTFMPGAEVSPSWSPDGKSIAFGKVFGDDLGVYIKPLDGGGERALIRVGSGEQKVFPTAWSPDGRYLICSRSAYIRGASSEILAFPLAGGEPLLLVGKPETGGAGRISGDGKWLAYDTASVVDSEVFVKPFLPGWEAERAAGRPVPQAGERYRVSIAGGGRPAWGSLGKTLFYASSSNSIIGVRWSTEGTRFVFDAGQAYIDFPASPNSQYDVLPNEELFVMNSIMSPRNVKLRLVLNWPALLKR